MAFAQPRVPLATVHSAWPEITRDTGGSFRRKAVPTVPLWRQYLGDRIEPVGFNYPKSPPPLPVMSPSSPSSPPTTLTRWGGYFGEGYHQDMRSVAYRGAWTISFVLASNEGGFWGSSSKIIHDGVKE